MASMLDDLMRTIGPGMTEELSQRLEADPRATRSAVEASIPVLVAALAKNASSPAGASALAGAIQRDHDGSLLDDLAGFFAHPERADGGGIVRHAFGAQQPAIEHGIAAKTGLDAQKIARIFQIVAPLVMAYLARAQQAAPASAAPTATQAPAASGSGGGLIDILTHELDNMKNGGGGGIGDILGGLLGAGSGSAHPDDLVNEGIGILKGMFH